MNRFVALGNTLPSIVKGHSELRRQHHHLQGCRIAAEPGVPQLEDFGPRLGFAYRAFDGAKSFVLRGGYRISYYTEPISNWFDSQSAAQLVSASFESSVSDTAVSPDGLPNYGLRSAPQYIAGVNTPDSIIDTNDIRTLPRGFSANFLDPHIHDPRVQDWNMTLEKEIMSDTVFRVSYLGNHTDNILQVQHYNDSTPSYIWYATQKTPLPTGAFASVATRPYDQQVWGNVNEYRTTGWSNFHGAQFEVERRFHHGVGFQFFYVLANTLGAGSSTSIPSQNTFLPGNTPGDFDSLNRFLNYRRDTTAPHHNIRWNWVAELPFGKGKAVLGNAHGWVDKLAGGWQVAGTGQWMTNYMALPASSTGIYPNGTPVEMYGYQYPIQDCRSGACYPGYLYWNGYIPANQINSHDANGNPNGVEGVPDNYKAAGAPLIPWGSTVLPANAPANTNLKSFWDTNTVWVPLSNGTAVQRTTYNNNLHPWRNQYINGPHQWFLDASLFKFVPINERVRLRFSVDFFNVLNNPNNPNLATATTDGILATRNSGSPARVTQLSLRLNW